MFSNSPNRKQTLHRIGGFIYKGQVMKASTGMKEPRRETTALRGRHRGVRGSRLSPTPCPKDKLPI